MIESARLNSEAYFSKRTGIKRYREWEIKYAIYLSLFAHPSIPFSHHLQSCPCINLSHWLARNLFAYPTWISHSLSLLFVCLCVYICLSACFLFSTSPCLPPKRLITALFLSFLLIAFPKTLPQLHFFQTFQSFPSIFTHNYTSDSSLPVLL